MLVLCLCQLIVFLQDSVEDMVDSRAQIKIHSRQLKASLAKTISMKGMLEAFPSL